MKYQITILKIEEVEVTKRGDHSLIDERPWTTDELQSEAMYQDKSDFLERKPVKKIYGYAPSYQTTEKKETEVLRQTVEEIDMPAVIKAVNGL